MASVGEEALAWLAERGIKIAQRPKDSAFAHAFLDARPSLDNLVEIGSDHGGSLFSLGMYVKPGGRIVSIDPFTHRSHFKGSAKADVATVAGELCSRGRIVTRIEKTSAEALETVREMFAEEGIDYLHIDGCHFYDEVRADFDGYAPLVRDGGAIQMHDIHNTKYGVKLVWSEVVGSFPDALTARHVGILPVHRG